MNTRPLQQVSNQIGHAAFIGLLGLASHACGAAHSLGADAASDAGSDAVLGDSVVLTDASQYDSGQADVGASGCRALFPQSAFIQDRITDLPSTPERLIGRGALQAATIQGQPDPGLYPAPATDAGGGGVPFRNCGFEPSAGFAWDGHRCRQVRETGLDFGPGAVFGSEAACAAAYATCQPQACRDSGGQWSEVPLSCRAWVNGLAPSGVCDSQNVAQCICPVGQSPDAAGRCGPSGIPLPADEAGCWASGGRMERTCDRFTCGQDPDPCGGSRLACNCGPGGTFNPRTNRCESAGCVSTVSALCRFSGGTVELGVNHPLCGVRAPGGGPPDREVCNCGALGVYIDGVGCQLAPGCRTNACF